MGIMKFFGKRKKVSREQIIWCYRTLLGREPESEEAILAHADHKNVHDLVDQVVKSPEFVENNSRGVSKEEIIWCFRTLLGRDPESEAAIAAHDNAKNFKKLVEAITASAEFRAKMRRVVPPRRRAP